MDLHSSVSESAAEKLSVVSKAHLKRLEEALKTLDLLALPPLSKLSLGEIIRIYRAMSGMPIAKLAAKAGIDRGHLALLEKNKYSPQQETIDDLAKVFGPKFKEAIAEVLKTHAETPPVVSGKSRSKTKAKNHT